MNRKEEIKKELEELSPFLSEIKKENPFQVPVNYFDQLSEDILKKVETREEVTATQAPRESWLDNLLAPLVQLFQPRLVLAGMAILLVAGFFIFRQGDTLDPIAAEGNELTEEEANAYVAANIEDFDIDLLTEMALHESPSSEEEIFLDEELIDEILDELETGDLEELL